MLHEHLVSVTKYRHPVLRERHISRVEEAMREVCADFETDRWNSSGEPNHVHLPVNSPAHNRDLAAGEQPQTEVSSRFMRKGVPRTAVALLASQNASDPAHISPDRSAEPRTSARSNSTSSNSNAPLRTGHSALGGLRDAVLHHRPEGRRTAPHFGSPQLPLKSNLRFQWKLRPSACRGTTHRRLWRTPAISMEIGALATARRCRMRRSWS
ncbi:hypothetical protein FDZ84_35280 [Saccharopolyspora sp. ASAGF58]|nr:hypothetical protein FDZ84_35280 [Saccharopolyspora sp. ASAGF58]